MKSIKLFKSKIFARALSFKQKLVEPTHREPVRLKGLTQQQWHPLWNTRLIHQIIGWAIHESSSIKEDPAKPLALNPEFV